MGEKFDTIDELMDRLLAAQMKLLEVFEAPDPSDNTALTPVEARLARQNWALFHHIHDLNRAVTSLGAYMAVVATGLNKEWMINGPALDMDDLSAGLNPTDGDPQS